MTVTFNRIIIFCGDVNSLKVFYEGNFGFRVIEEITDEWVVLSAGFVEIAFHRIGEAYRNNNEPFHADSNTKLVFEINGDIVAFRETLLKNGVQLNEIKSFKGFDYLLCDGEDPEGNIFQLKQIIPSN
jgi:hypothetical protein